VVLRPSRRHAACVTVSVWPTLPMISARHAAVLDVHCQFSSRTAGQAVGIMLAACSRFSVLIHRTVLPSNCLPSRSLAGYRLS